MLHLKIFKTLLVFLVFISCESNDDSSKWISLFDGKSLDGWEMKIAGYGLNDNHKNTFRVGDGTIKVTYEDYDLFDENFGHIFYTNKKFKNYHLKLDYRFYGEHVNSFTNENDAWNYKNSGVMLHSEHPNQMFIDQGFPVSIEGQFLGGSGVNDRPTLNMCSPGTEVDINGTKAICSTVLTLLQKQFIL